MKILELFSGYGTASFALKQLGINYECVGYSDIDKYANQCFRQNHIETNLKNGCWGFHNYAKIPNELGDATKINPNNLKDFDLLTGGFPCQAFSVAGKGLGELDTRGTLFNEIIRIAEVKKPRYMLLENVKGLLSKRHRQTFIKITNELHRIGYYVRIRVLNTKDYGVPQNRERVWFACFREKKDWNKFEFPEKEELNIFLKDILEDKVDEKYYLKQYTVDRLLNNGQGFRSKIRPEIGSCLSASMHKVPRGMDMIQQLNNPKHSNDRVYSEDGISPTLSTMQGGNRQPFIVASRGRRNKEGKLYQNLEKGSNKYSNCLTSSLKENYVADYLPIKNATKKGYLEGYPNDGVNLEQPNSTTPRGRIQKNVMGCLQTNDQRGVITEDFRIRKLTPKECFRLQGFINDEINLKGLSNTQQYKLAGNGQSVNVVKKIFEMMLL